MNKIEEGVWIKASASAANGNCVEASRVPGGVVMRDSKDSPGPHLSFEPGAMAAFLTDANAGELDWLVDGEAS